jgi:hypothetical protein
MELSGQEYVDVYAQVAKDRAKAERAAAGKAEESSSPDSADRPEHPTAPAA